MTNVIDLVFIQAGKTGERNDLTLGRKRLGQDIGATSGFGYRRLLHVQQRIMYVAGNPCLTKCCAKCFSPGMADDTQMAGVTVTGR